MPDPLERVPFGRTGLRVTRLGFGSAPLATYFWGNDEATAAATVARAVELGIGLFDVAPLYGLGESEERLGAALPVARDSYVLATKVGRTLVDSGQGGRDAIFDYSADAVRRGLEASCERLRTDRIDIVHVHDPDDHLDAAFDGAFPTLLALRDEGVIGAVSVGTNSVATAEAAFDRVDLDAMLVAGRLTLLDRSARSLAERCARRGVGYLAAGVFNSGVLARPGVGAWYDYGTAGADILERVDRIGAACRDAGVGLVAAALQFPLTCDGVTALVVGMSSPAEVDADVEAMRAPIDAAVWQAIDAAAE